MEVNSVTTPASINQNISQQHFFYCGIWLTDFIINSFLCILSLYIVVALIFYELKRSGRKAKNLTALSKEGKFSQTTREICIATSVTTFFYQVFSLCTLSIQKVASTSHKTFSEKNTWETTCQILSRLEIFNVIMGTGLIYLFLWSRQRVFYINPLLKTLNSKCVKITSYFLLALWFCSFIPASIVYCAIVRYKFRQPGGCLIVDETILFYRDIILTWMIVSIFMQIALLSLFLNPILRRTQLMKRNSRKSSVNSNSAVTPTVRLLQRVKKAVVLTLTCLASDVFAASLTLLIYQPDANNYVFMYNVNFMINLFAIIGCFDNWSFMLWPWTEKIKTNKIRHRQENLSCRLKDEHQSMRKKYLWQDKPHRDLVNGADVLN